MNTTANVQQPANRHPWKDAEPDFQRVLAQERGQEVALEECAAAADRLCRRCQQSALPVMQRWGLRNAEDLSRDVAQEWYVQLRTGILKRCDDRPVHRVAYTAMTYLCMAASRSARRHVGLPDGFDVIDQQGTALEWLVNREEQELLETGIASLPPKLQHAAESLRNHSRGGDARHFSSLSRKSRLARYRNTYRARRLLKKRLMQHRNLDA